MMTPCELRQHLKISGATYHRLQKKGVLPPAVRVGSYLRYRESDIEIWENKQIVLDSQIEK